MLVHPSEIIGTTFKNCRNNLQELSEQPSKTVGITFGTARTTFNDCRNNFLKKASEIVGSLFRKMFEQSSETVGLKFESCQINHRKLRNIFRKYRYNLRKLSGKVFKIVGTTFQNCRNNLRDLWNNL